MSTETDKKDIKEELLCTKDRWLVYIMIAKRMLPVKITPTVTDTGQRVLLFFFDPTEEAKDIFDRKLRGDMIPIEDVGELERAERVFKNNVQLYQYQN